MKHIPPYIVTPSQQKLLDSFRNKVKQFANDELTRDEILAEEKILTDAKIEQGEIVKVYMKVEQSMHTMPCSLTLGVINRGGKTPSRSGETYPSNEDNYTRTKEDNQ
jgi:hypothetical protein